MAVSAPPCVGRLHGVLAVLRARAGRSRFHRPWPMDATPERDAAPVQSAFWFAPTPSHPLKGPLLHVPARGPNRHGRARENRSELP